MTRAKIRPKTKREKERNVFFVRRVFDSIQCTLCARWIANTRIYQCTVLHAHNIFVKIEIILNCNISLITSSLKIIVKCTQLIKVIIHFHSSLPDSMRKSTFPLLQQLPKLVVLSPSIPYHRTWTIMFGYYGGIKKYGNIVQFILTGSMNKIIIRPQRKIKYSMYYN